MLRPTRLPDSILTEFLERNQKITLIISNVFRFKETFNQFLLINIKQQTARQFDPTHENFRILRFATIFSGFFLFSCNIRKTRKTRNIPF